MVTALLPETSLCVCLIGPSQRELEDQWARAAQYADLVELRCDRLRNVPLEVIAQLRHQYNLPLLLTVRDGDIAPWLRLSPDMIDVEMEWDGARQEQFFAAYHNAVVYSLHGPEALDLGQVERLMSRPGAAIYKVAAPHETTTDCLRWCEQVAQLARLHGVQWAAMGLSEGGAASRVIAPLLGASMVYASVGEPFVPGQIEGEELMNQFRFRSLTPKTRLMGVLGDPVCYSPGPRLHNQLMHDHGIDAVYVPLRAGPTEVGELLELTAQLNPVGFSVTLPLKDQVRNFCQEAEPVATAANAINTLVWRNGSWSGHNTDGRAAIELMVRRIGSLQGKRVVILGAGATGRATSYEAMKAGAEVTILSRTPDRGALAAHLGCRIGLIQDLHLEQGMDVLVHATRIGFEDGLNGHLVPESVWRQKPLFLDVIHTRPTQLIERARMAGCGVITGTEMFNCQAALQWELWFG
jgi:shikimate dehydrogenase